MILPSGDFRLIIDKFIGKDPYCFLGCISTEQRSIAIPYEMIDDQCIQSQLLVITDPPDAFPDNSKLAEINTKKNEDTIEALSDKFKKTNMELLAPESQLLDVLSFFKSTRECSTIILDITSFPKRYFCFFIMRLLMSPWHNVILTYTDASSYPRGHLSTDTMTSDYLPGFGVNRASEKANLVIAVGFESHGIRSIVDQYAYKPTETKYILSFPPDGKYLKRQWLTLLQLWSGNASRLKSENMRSIATWDAEEVYIALKTWYQQTGDLVLAPFGAKTHTLGMALFAIENECPLIYSQPKSYNPSYAIGYGHKWAYVVKWEGVPCFKREHINL